MMAMNEAALRKKTAHGPEAGDGDRPRLRALLPEEPTAPPANCPQSRPAPPAQVKLSTRSLAKPRLRLASTSRCWIRRSLSKAHGIRIREEDSRLKRA